MIVFRYFSNIIVALYNLLGAVLFIYRPNGDGWFHSVAYCVDCTGNALTGGDPRETISSRAGKAQKNGKRWACLLCRLLDAIQRGHCTQSINPGSGANAILPD